MKYVIKPEFWDLWSNGMIETKEQAIVEYDEIQILSKAWNIPIDKLMQQVEEIEN